MEDYYDRPGILLNGLFSKDNDDEEEEEDLNMNHNQGEFEWIQNALINFKNQEVKIDLNTPPKQLNQNNEQTLEFIGAHPVSLLRSHFNEIKQNQNDWLVCEKTDGVRYLMLILNNGNVYLTGRNVGGKVIFNQIQTIKNKGLQQVEKRYQLFRINMKIPALLVENAGLCIQELFDGELIVDVVNGKERLHYLIFDTLIHNGIGRVNKRNVQGVYSYFERLKCAQEYLEMLEVAKKVGSKKQQEQQQQFQGMPQLQYFPRIRVLLKDFFQICQLKYLIKIYIPMLPHGNDGLVFTQNSAPYRTGTCEQIRKWKPPEKNTIDFLICPNVKIGISDSGVGLLELYVMGKFEGQPCLMLFDVIQVSSEEVEAVELRIKQQFEIYEKEGVTQAVKGVIGECGLERVQEKQEKICRLFTPATWGRDVSEVDQFLKDLLKNTNHVDMLNGKMIHAQLQLLKQVREMIHLKLNFKFRWQTHKYRSDKVNPNSFRVAQNIIDIINENLSQDNLIEILGI